MINGELVVDNFAGGGGNRSIADIGPQHIGVRG